VGYKVFQIDIDEEEHVALPMVRKMAPPSTSLEEYRVHRELSPRI